MSDRGRMPGPRHPLCRAPARRIRRRQQRSASTAPRSSSAAKKGYRRTSNNAVAQEYRALRTHWQDPSGRPAAAEQTRLQLPARQPLAALARISLTRFTQLLARRQEQTAPLQAMIEGTPGITVPALRPGEDWNGYAPLFRLELPRSRAFSQHLAARGVPNSVASSALPPVTSGPCSRRTCRPACATRRGSSTTLWLSPSATATAMTRSPATPTSLPRRHADGQPEPGPGLPGHDIRGY